MAGIEEDRAAVTKFEAGLSGYEEAMEKLTLTRKRGHAEGD